MKKWNVLAYIFLSRAFICIDIHFKFCLAQGLATVLQSFTFCDDIQGVLTV